MQSLRMSPLPTYSSTAAQNSTNTEEQASEMLDKIAATLNRLPMSTKASMLRAYDATFMCAAALAEMCQQCQICQADMACLHLPIQTGGGQLSLTHKDCVI